MRTVGYDDRDRGKRGVQPADRTSGCVGVIGSEWAVWRSAPGGFHRLRHDMGEDRERSTCCSAGSRDQTEGSRERRRRRFSWTLDLGGVAAV